MLSHKDDVIEDSVEFHIALKIWNPEIFAAMSTLRDVKLYQNRLRYLASVSALRSRPRPVGPVVRRQETT